MFQYFDKTKFIFRCEITLWLLLAAYVFVLITFIKVFSPQKNEKTSYDYNQTYKILQNNYISNYSNAKNNSIGKTSVKSVSNVVPIDRISRLPPYQKVLLEKLELKIQYEIQNNENFSQVFELIVTVLRPWLIIQINHPRLQSYNCNLSWGIDRRNVDRIVTKCHKVSQILNFIKTSFFFLSLVK